MSFEIHLHDMIKLILESECYDDIMIYINKATTLGEKARIPLCICLARIAEGRLYEQEGYDGITSFSEERFGFSKSTTSYFIQIGQVIIENELHILTWLNEPDSDISKLIFLYRALQNHPDIYEVMKKMRELTFREFKNYADSPWSELDSLIPPESILPSVYNKVLTNLKEMEKDSSLIERAYHEKEDSSAFVRNHDRDSDVRDEVLVDLLRMSQAFQDDRQALIPTYLAEERMDRLRRQLSLEERYFVDENYSKCPNGQYRRNFLISNESKGSLEDIFLKNGIKNPAISRLETYYEPISSIDLRRTPIKLIRTKYLE